MNKVKFAHKEIRKRLGVTLVELVRKTGLLQQTISKYENRENLPLIDVAARLVQALGVSLDELVIMREE